MDFGSEERRGFPQTVIKSILKKASKVLKSDIAAARYEGEQTKKTDKFLPSFSLQCSLMHPPPPSSSLPQSSSSSPQSSCKRFSPPPRMHPPPRPPRTHSQSAASSPSSSQTLTTDYSLIQRLAENAQEIQRNRSEQAVQLRETHKRCMCEALKLLSGKGELEGGGGGGGQRDREGRVRQ